MRKNFSIPFTYIFFLLLFLSCSFLSSTRANAKTLMANMEESLHTANVNGLQKTSSPPQQFDLRDLNAVTSVKNQGSGNICWSYATISSIESNMIMKGLANNTINLSEKHLTWFTKHSYNQKVSNSSLKDGIYVTPWSGCDPSYAGYTLMGWSGPTLESTFPIKNVNDLSTYGSIGDKYRYHSLVHVQDMTAYAKDDISSIKLAIMNNGGMVVSFYSSPEYYDTNSEAGTSIYCNKENVIVNHSVCIIGWDDNYSKKNFNSSNRPSQDGAWLIKNSWGTNIGEHGYQWISYEDKTTSGFLQFGVEAKSNYDVIYQYDNFGSSVQKGSNASEIKGSNIFTASNNNVLKATSVYTSVGNVNYTVSIYKNSKKNTSNPESGQLCTTQKGTFSNIGYHTVKLKQTVPLPKGTRFSIVVTFSSRSPNGEKWISLEGSNKTYESDRMKETYGTFFYTSNKGESFYNISGTWIDAHSAGYNNVCIKAYACNSSSITQSTTSKPLNAPSQIKVVKETPSKVTLSWSKVKKAKGYQIFYSTKKNKGFRLIGRRTNAKQNTFLLDNLNNNTTYYFKVQAYHTDSNHYKISGKFSKTRSISMKKTLSFPEIKVTPKKLSLKKNKKRTIKIVLPKSVTSKSIKSISYKPANKKIISVSKKGILKGKKKGNTILKVSISLKNGRKKSFYVYVNIK